MSQSEADNTVKPRDELVKISVVVGAREFMAEEVLGDRSPEAALADALARTATVARARALSAEWHVVLMFRARRALRQLEIEDEISKIRGTGCKVSAQAATIEALRGLIAASSCRALHLSVHCAVQQGRLLFLEDQDGKANIVRADNIRKLLTQGQDEQSIHLVFLNSCHSYTLGSHFVEAGVRHVVCVRDEDEVFDRSCGLFASHFWSALRGGRTVRQAFDCGTAALEFDGELRRDAGAFVLLPEGGEHDVVIPCTDPGRVCPRGHDMLAITGTTHVCDVCDCSGTAWRCGGGCDYDLCSACAADVGSGGGVALASGRLGMLPQRVEDFVGREVDMHELLQSLRMRHFVEVYGCPGVGKSTLLAEVGRFVRLRQNVFAEVVYVGGEVGRLDEVLAELASLLEQQDRPAQRRPMLLLLDHADSLCTPSLEASLERMLRYGGIHAAVALSTPSPMCAVAGVGNGESNGLPALPSATAWSGLAMRVGLKPVAFPLGPLEPLAQARLFLRRARRPLRVSEAFDASGGVSAHADAVLKPSGPADLLRLADSALLRGAEGVPRRIIQAAFNVGAEPPPIVEWQPAAAADQAAGPATVASQASAAICRGPAPQGLEGRRKVRLKRPDGRERDVWLSAMDTVGHILASQHCPVELQGGAADIVIGGCVAPEEATIGDFSDDAGQGILVLEFQRKQAW